MKILITGSKGVVGSKLTSMLQTQHEVFGIDLFHEPGEIGWEHEMVGSKATYARCDVSDFRQLERIFERFGPFDLVYHTAAEFGRWNGEDYYEQLWRTNAIGTKNIIRLQEKLWFQLVHFSSSEVYGDYAGVMSEDVMKRVAIPQLNDYAMSKWVNEMQIKNSAASRGTESVVVRLFNTYGPGESYHPYRSVNAKFCYHALHGLPITVYRGHERTSTYLDDACRALVAISSNFHAGMVYNIGGGNSHTIEKLAEIVWKYTGASRDLITFKDSEVLTTKVKMLDNSRAIADLGFKATVSLKDGVEQTINWMRTV